MLKRLKFKCTFALTFTNCITTFHIKLFYTFALEAKCKELNLLIRVQTSKGHIQNRCKINSSNITIL